MINGFKVKRWTAFILASFIPLILFYVGLIFYNVYFGLGFAFLGILLTQLIGAMLIENPFTAVLEGNGIVVADMNSTGVITPFNLKVLPSRIMTNESNLYGKYQKQEINDYFDRNCVFHLAQPKGITTIREKIIKGLFFWKKKRADPFTAQVIQKVEVNKETNEKKSEEYIEIRLKEEEYNRNRMALHHLPFLLYNSATGTFYTKDFFSDKEKTELSENRLIFISKKVEFLANAATNISRHVIDLALKPKFQFAGSRLFMIILIIAIIILVLVFAPQIWNTLKSSFAGGVGVP